MMKRHIAAVTLAAILCMLLPQCASAAVVLEIGSSGSNVVKVQ